MDDNVSHLRVVVKLTEMHKLHEAMPYMRRAWELYRRLFGDTDPRTAASLRELLWLNGLEPHTEEGSGATGSSVKQFMLPFTKEI